MTNENLEQVKKGIIFSLENIWNLTAEKRPNWFKQKDGRTWLFVRYCYLIQQYCKNTTPEEVMSVLNTLAREGYLTFYTVGTGSNLAYVYSLSSKQKGFVPVKPKHTYAVSTQPKKSFDTDEFYKASLYKAKETGVAPVPPEAHNDPRTSAFYHYDKDGYEIF